MIITISGEAGSGKSTVTKILSQDLNFKVYCTGDMQRKIANQMDITIVELGELEKKDKSIDNKVDLETQKLGETQDNFIMDSWLAAKFIPHATKIFLFADISVRVQRRTKQVRKEENFTDFDEAKAAMQKREDTNQKRWIEFYDFDYKNKDNYDIVIDTTNLSAQEVAKQIIEKIKK